MFSNQNDESFYIRNQESKIWQKVWEHYYETWTGSTKYKIVLGQILPVRVSFLIYLGLGPLLVYIGCS